VLELSFRFITYAKGCREPAGRGGEGRGGQVVGKPKSHPQKNPRETVEGGDERMVGVRGRHKITKRERIKSFGPLLSSIKPRKSREVGVLLCI